MTKVVCDRCGATIHIQGQAYTSARIGSVKIGMIVVTASGNELSYKYDLCAECRVDFNDFVKNR